MSLDESPETALILVPEIRDYERINLEIAARLQAGFRRILLQGVEGQRLLVSGLSGDWQGTVILRGRAGPDLGAGLNVPRLTVICEGDVADGVGHSLRGGLILVRGDAGTCAGYGQTGGQIVIEGNAGPRAGINQKGGLLAILGQAGDFAGERRRNGILALFGDRVGKLRDHAATGGRFLDLDRDDPPKDGLDPEILAMLSVAIQARRAASSSAPRGMMNS